MAAPGRYVAYSDDDILFLPNWLSAALEIVNAFPQAGVVSCLPHWGGFGKSTAGTIVAAKQDPAVGMTATKGWPLDWAQDYAESIGWDTDAFVRLCKDKEK